MMARSSPYWRKEEIQEEIKVTKVNHDQWVVILWCLVQIPIRKIRGNTRRNQSDKSEFEDSE